MAGQTISSSSNIPLFVENQILRAEDLNKLADALQAQLRQTRVFNIGIGIVNGLKTSWVLIDGDERWEIKVSAGLGISSDGYQFDLAECNLGYLRGVALSERAFSCDTRSECNSELDILSEAVNVVNENGTGFLQNISSVYELEENNPGDWFEITEEAKEVLTDYCLVMLWCEERVDRKSCFNDCEEKGADQSVKIRQFMISRKVYEELFAPADENGGTPSPVVTLPPPPAMKRFGYVGNDKIDLCSISEWSTFYQNYLDVTGGVVNSLQLVYQAAYANFYFKTLSDPDGSQSPFDDFIPKELMSATGPYQSPPVDICRDIQYLYTYLRELIVAYEEFRSVAEGLVILSGGGDESLEKCLFPGHISLGVVPESGDAEEEDDDGDEAPEDEEAPQITCRTGRILPNIFPETQEKLRLAECLYERMVALATTGNRLPTVDPSRSFDIRITPSANRFRYLRRHALPFYYNGDAVAPYWNCEEDIVQVHHYEPQKGNPLLDDLCIYDFLRVEGHLGETLNSVEGSISQLRKQLNLPFDILTVRIGPGAELDVADELVVGELEEVYRNTRLDLLCKLDELRNDNNELEDERLLALQNALSNYRAIRDIPVNDPVEEADTDCTNCDRKKPADDLFVDFDQVFNDAVNATANNGPLPSFHQDQGKLIESLARKYHTFKYEVESQKSFPCFAKAHPGLEHKGGVPKGGTLVLVYAYKIREGQRQAVFNLLNIPPTQIEDKTDEDLVRGLLQNQQIPASSIKSFVKQVVVADFCLPYLCCSGAPIVRNELRAVRPKVLADPYFCCIDDLPKIPFSLSPAGGILEVIFQENVVADLSSDTDEPFDTANILDADDFDKYRAGITFRYTLGGESANTTVTIYKFPEVVGFQAEKIEPCCSVHADENGEFECRLDGYRYRFTPVDSDGNATPFVVTGLTKLSFKFGTGDSMEEIFIMKDGELEPGMLEAEFVDAERNLEFLEHCIKFDQRIQDPNVEDFGTVPVEVCFENGPCSQEMPLNSINDLCPPEELEMETCIFLLKPNSSQIQSEDCKDVVVNDDGINEVGIPVGSGIDPGFLELKPSVPCGQFNLNLLDPATGELAPLLIIVDIPDLIENAEDCSGRRFFLVYDKELARNILTENIDNPILEDYPLTPQLVDTAQDIALSEENSVTGEYRVDACGEKVFDFTLKIVSFGARKRQDGEEEKGEEDHSDDDTTNVTDMSGERGDNDVRDREEIVVARGISASSPHTNMRAVLNQRQTNYRNTLQQLQNDLGASKGFKLANIFLSTQGEVGKLTDDYQAAVQSLLIGRRSANEENESKYERVLRTITYSLLDKLAAVPGQTVDPEALKAVKDSVIKMKEAGMTISTFRRQWKAADLKQVLPEAKVTTLNDQLKA